MREFKLKYNPASGLDYNKIREFAMEANAVVTIRDIKSISLEHDDVVITGECLLSGTEISLTVTHDVANYVMSKQTCYHQEVIFLFGPIAIVGAQANKLVRSIGFIELLDSRLQ